MIANLKDPNDPNADEDGAKEPAKKCMFVKDSIYFQNLMQNYLNAI